MGKFVISKTKAGAHFNLKAGNGEIIGTSQVYATVSSCKRGAQSVAKNAGVKIEDQTEQGFSKLTNPKYEVYKDRKGEFRFRLKASNGENILASEGYTSKKGCMNAIDSIKRNAPKAAIEIEE